MPRRDTKPIAKALLARFGSFAEVINAPEERLLEVARLKALLRGAAGRTVDGLWEAIGDLIDRFTPDECNNYFAAAGYEPE